MAVRTSKGCSVVRCLAHCVEFVVAGQRRSSYVGSLVKLWSVRADIRSRIVSSCIRRSRSVRGVCVASVVPGLLCPWPRIASPLFTLLPCVLVLSVSSSGRSRRWAFFIVRGCRSRSS